jgi:Ca2+:H+ antiporter
MSESTPTPAEPPKSGGIGGKLLYFLLVAIPIAAVLHFTEDRELVPHPKLWVFITACIAIIPLAGLMGRATENLSEAMGPSIGGLLNATFGNAAELIIALFALRAGKVDLVKASITGSILGNILLVLGLSIVAGGFFHRRQTFNRTSASLGATLLALASIGLIVPTIYFELTKNVPAAERSATLNFLSEEIAGILALMYVLSLLFNLLTHRHLFAGPETERDVHAEPPEWGKLTSIIVLLVATAGVAWMSEMLVGSVEEAGAQLGMNHVFVGVIVVAIIGNAAEHSTAILVAMKDQMDLAFTIAIGSSIQIALFVAPVLVFAGWAMGGSSTLDLHFSSMEVISVIIAAGVTYMVSQDGETHWMEGAMLLAVYVMLALAFYHLPVPTPAAPH